MTVPAELRDSGRCGSGEGVLLMAYEETREQLLRISPASAASAPVRASPAPDLPVPCA